MDTKELIINRLQHLAIEQGLDMDNCKDIAEVYEKHLTKLQNTSSNSDYTKCKIEAEIKRLEENPEGDYVTRISALEWALRIIAERYATR